ncbi:MAG: FAD:protein FMN transferase [Anaerovoracaceae bacterium]
MAIANKRCEPRPRNRMHDGVLLCSGPCRSMLRHILAVLLILLLIIPQAGCSSNGENYQGIAKTGFYLDTVCTITIYGVDPDSDLGKELAEVDEEGQQKQIFQLITDAFLECDRCEKILSKTLDSSEISKINAAGGRTVTVSDMTAEVIEKGLEYGTLSNGVFDITIGKVTDLWNFHDFQTEDIADGEGGAGEGTDPLPDPELLKEAVRHVDYRKVSVDEDQVALQDPEMEIDLGGIAKGYIADHLTQWLEECGVVSAVIDLGGNIVAIGGKSAGLLELPQQDFTIGIKDPQSESGQLLGIFECSDKTVVTSGTYERYVVKDGKKYHHILNPETGWPAETDVNSVTIITEKNRAVDGDGLSTTCLALGVEKGTALIESIEGAEAVFVDLDGNITSTSGAPALTTR